MRRAISKAVSEIFSTLIVALIVLAMSGPLFYFYHQISSTQKSTVNSVINNEILSSEMKIRIIKIGNFSNDIFLFNYGKINVHIESVIVDGKIIETNQELSAGTMISLSSLVGNVTVTGPLIINANGQYFIE
ncbi:MULTISPECIES: pilin subunit UpsB [Metallosphaera]|uniref:Uncharacterized protein n=4 Tax=Metallosphaera TaxID=41980 RepID=A4YIJ4_METS5|nr:MULTISPECIES: hypothetical protein [Metallosphaera]ABP96246.1 hypothetical protein Msed_2107 [Metallosphaera sedula DSM 5348]AIM28229.1 hypothetical protein HA72_2107 [Metallosphaera sedula]AKV84005.1 hypothetical protein MsedE_2159 [Metallosphaera sedula]MCY0861094.1 hypothetical protein [Metallosphaera prunae]WPX06068.1 hypothetical protein SOJ17_002122 [Metallosphaera sedula DSM 5348]